MNVNPEYIPVWSFYLALIGSAGTALIATSKIWSYFQDKWFGIRISTSLTGSSEIGNTICVFNNLPLTINIFAFDLVWVKRRPWGIWLPLISKIVRVEDRGEYEFCDITILPNHQRQFSFEEEYHFDWGANLKERIYFRIWINGNKRPKWFFVTGPN